MRAGALDRSISIERRTDTVDAAGTVTAAWVQIATARAELVANALTERGIAAGEAETAALTFRTRYLADITTNDRLTYEGQAFNIVGIDEIGRRRGLTLRVERVTA